MDALMSDTVRNKIEEFFEQYRQRHYPKGQILILNGDDAKFVYHLLSGKVKEYDVTYRGDEIILNVFKPPAFFPMSLAINQAPNPYVYEAESDVELRQAPVEDVIAFIKKNPDVLYDLLSRVYRGVDGLLGRMVHLMGSSAKSRFIYELLLEARRFGSLQDDGSCRLSINEKELGARAGLSRETVSREASKLKSEGLIEINSKQIVIKDLVSLQKKLGQEV